MQNSENYGRRFVDQRYPSVIISEAELKKDYGKQIAEGEIDPTTLRFEEWLFNQQCRNFPSCSAKLSSCAPR